MLFWARAGRALLAKTLILTQWLFRAWEFQFEGQQMNKGRVKRAVIWVMSISYQKM